MAAQGTGADQPSAAQIEITERAAAAAEPPVPDDCSMATVLPARMPGAARDDAALASCAEMRLLEVLHFNSEPPSAQVKGGAAIQMLQRARLRQRQWLWALRPIRSGIFDHGDAFEWPQCGCLSTVRLAPQYAVVGQSPDR